jgi:hypothetical protein
MPIYTFNLDNPKALVIALRNRKSSREVTKLAACEGKKVNLQIHAASQQVVDL